MEDNTIKFVVPDDAAGEMKAILTAVYSALSEKGYNPINQILGQQVTDDLIDGVIPFFTQRAVYGCEQCFHLLIGFIGNYKFDRIVVHIG